MRVGLARRLFFISLNTMFYFIVSGYIPGTDIQVTLEMLALALACVLTAILLTSHIITMVRETRELVQKLQMIERISL